MEKIPKIISNRLKSAEFERIQWVATVEQGVTREDLLEPSFWSLAAVNLSPYNRIEVRCDDGTFYGEYLVLDSSRTWAKLYELSFHQLTSSDVSLSQTEKPALVLDIAFKGPHKKWCVLRGEDILQEGMLKNDAEDWARNHMKAMA